MLTFWGVVASRARAAASKRSPASQAPRAARPPARRAPQQSRAQATVEAILGAARKILVKHGRAALSTNKVAEVAGVSIGSLYQYFPDKDAILSELGRRHVEEATALVAERLVSVVDAPPREAARAMVALMIDLHRHDPALHRVLVEELPKGGMDRLGRIESEVTGLVRAYLERHAGQLRVDDLDLAAAVVVQSVEALTHGAVLFRPGLLESRKFEDAVVDLIARYLVAD